MRDSREWRLMTWREKSLFRLTLTCMCISPEAVESRDQGIPCTGVSAQRIFKKRYYHRGWPSGYRWRKPASVENLVAKARALTEEGMTVYTLTSSYGYPPTTLTGSVERDIILVPPMIGVKVAVSDHRSSNPGGEELIALATAARRAGLLSNTPGW